MTIAIPLERPHAIGLLLLGGAAGAPFLPKLAESAQGDLGFAVALTTLLTVCTTIFMPLALPLVIPGLQASPWSIARPLLVFMLMPLAIGMILKNRSPAISSASQPIFRKLATLSALVLLGLLAFLYFRDLFGIFGSGAILACLVFVTGLYIAGYLLGGAQMKTRGVLGLGTAARNIGAALVSASQSFPDSKVMIMLVAGTIVTLLVLLPAAAWLRRERLS